MSHSLKILLITKNYHGWFASGELDYQLELAKQADVTFLGSNYPNYTRGMDLAQFERDHGPFDVIYYSLSMTEPNGIFTHIKDTKAPKVGYMHDGHNYMTQMLQGVRKWDTSLALIRSWAAHWLLYARQLDCPVKFHPQSINPTVFKDYGLEKLYDVCFPGIILPHYPLRCKMQQGLNKLRREGEMKVKFTYHIGYGKDFREAYPRLKSRGMVWKEDYAKLMHQSKITLTTGGRFNACIRRYFEVPACKSLLLAPAPFLHGCYGFEPYKHFVPVHAGNWLHELRYYLKNYDQFCKSIVKPAYEWVHKYHTTPVRVRQLLDIFETVLNWHSSKLNVGTAKQPLKSYSQLA